jgi:hypothetical protein
MAFHPTPTKEKIPRSHYNNTAAMISHAACISSIYPNIAEESL